MEWVTTTAKTLPEAIDLALDNLGVDESEAEIVVLEEPSKGLFGRVRGTARVEARVKPKAIRPKTERGRNRRGRSDTKSRGERSRRSRSSDRGGRSSSNNGNRSASGGTGSEGGQRSRSQGGSQGTRAGSKDSGRNETRADANAVATAKEATVAEHDTHTRSRSGSDSQGNERTRSDGTGAGGGSGEGRSSRRRRRRSKGSGGGSGSDTNTGGGTDRNTKNDRKNADNKQEETPVEEVAEHLRSFLGGLTEAFGLEGDVDIDTSETDVMVATVQGQHGLMVGPKGRTLDAIQELARVSSQRAAPSNIRIRVDVGGYRRQRAAALGDFARKAADQAVDNGVEVALEPMSPADRKSIHDALVDDGRVETRSVGTEPRRKVVVIPVSGGSSDRSEEE